jgi:hypothetical protein
MGTRTSGRVTTPKAEPMLEDVDFEEEDEAQPAQSQPVQRSHASDRCVCTLGNGCCSELRLDVRFVQKLRPLK